MATKYYAKLIGEDEPLAVARIHDDESTEVYSSRQEGWQPGRDSLYSEIVFKGDWDSLAEQRALDLVSRLDEERRRRASGEAAVPAYQHWLSVPEKEDEPRVLLRSADGKTLEGYAVSSTAWERLPYPATPALDDPRLWQKVAESEVPDVLGGLHAAWAEHLREEFDATAPELVDTELTEAAVRQGVVFYIVEILKVVPKLLGYDLTVGFKAPRGGATGGAGSGAVGPKGAWNFQVNYKIWGFPEGAQPQVFEAFKRMFDEWGWSYRYDEDGPAERDINARTSPGGVKTKTSYHVTVSQRPHGGMTMVWTSPYYPAEHADEYLDMPSAITKDGPQSYADPYAE
ncbi:hypothetical protein Srot_2391 [Segniliparus rotundus DSM 44985]|uniref:Uncharacterized protein n=1 Tax=Segniliparus rotundus (strain ATCC BAA-972 / CDC 1076 / CIP 108378 / DSM 44985 / JCM 13578) TaxID=640132 RepID=D6ZAU9_SEGRD|nr:hypothetical protein [Segniliparus rotundus]ADG98835.1 hypothetical protein Srot_2391 [Segniliparus rotundus DSM 44985]